MHHASLSLSSPGTHREQKKGIKRKNPRNNNLKNEF
jgi:hypothetical protein